MDTGNSVYSYQNGEPVIGTVVAIDTELEGGTPLVNFPTVGEVLLTKANMANGTNTLKKVKKNAEPDIAEKSAELRKQAAVKRAIYDLE